MRSSPRRPLGMGEGCGRGDQGQLLSQSPSSTWWAQGSSSGHQARQCLYPPAPGAGFYAVVMNCSLLEPKVKQTRLVKGDVVSEERICRSLACVRSGCLPWDRSRLSANAFMSLVCRLLPPLQGSQWTLDPSCLHLPRACAAMPDFVVSFVNS